MAAAGPVVYSTVRSRLLHRRPLHTVDTVGPGSRSVEILPVHRSIRPAALVTALIALASFPASAAPEDGAIFKDWTTRCEETEASETPTCYIFQNLTLKKDNRRLLHVAVGYLREGDQPAAFFTLPLGVSLPGGLSLTVDNGKPVRMRYERCETTGCLAPLALNDQLIRAFKGGRWARVAFFDASRQEVSVPVSLLGFTAGFNALR